jgi:hypothetical protein
MKKIAAICLLLSLAALVGCDGRIEGTYFNVGNTMESIELKKDGKFTLKGDNKVASGSYSVDGKAITLNPESKAAAKGKLEGDIITDSEGIKWKKMM